MRVRWLPIALGLSLMANVGLIALVYLVALDAGHYQSDQQSSWRSLAAERVQLSAMREHFCPNANPTRADLLTWEVATRPSNRHAEPYDKDGLLWLGDVGVRLDDAQRLTGVCLYMTWQALDHPQGADLDQAGAVCPPESLC